MGWCRSASSSGRVPSLIAGFGNQFESVNQCSFFSLLEKITPDVYGPSIGRVRILILGGEWSGKSNSSEAVASFYQSLGLGNGKFLVQSEGISELLRASNLRLPAGSLPLWVLVAEDMTLADIPPWDRRKWFQIRHVVAKATGFRRGFVVSVSNVHTFYGLDKDLRTEFDCLIIKSVPTNRNDRSMLRALLGGGSGVRERELGEKYLRWLELKSLAAIREPANRRFALVWLLDGSVSEVEIPWVTPILTDVTPREFVPRANLAFIGLAAFILTYVALMLLVVGR